MLIWPLSMGSSEWFSFFLSASGSIGNLLPSLIYFVSLCLCVINRVTRPKSGYGGKWDPRKWQCCCTKRDQQKTCVSVCGGHLCADMSVLCNVNLLTGFVFDTSGQNSYENICVKLLMCLSSPYYRPDFDDDDDDEGNKLFRYICLSVLS